MKGVVCISIKDINLAHTFIMNKNAFIYSTNHKNNWVSRGEKGSNCN